jgi:hypothetical protein
MPDISMCKGETDKGFICPMRDTCYRYTAKPSEYMQTYFAEPPIFNKKCEYYMENNYGKNERTVRSNG